MSTILSAIGSSVSDDPTIGENSGITKAVDILCLQESNGASTTGTAYAVLLNQIYGTTAYNAGAVSGTSTGTGTQSVVYNSSAVTLDNETTIGTSSTSGQPRQALRYQFTPIGYTSGSAADFNSYNNTEPGYVKLLSSGNGQANDPISQQGKWSTPPSNRYTHKAPSIPHPERPASPAAAWMTGSISNSSAPT